jgi:LytS/YehU family sensor histidine kinase
MKKTFDKEKNNRIPWTVIGVVFIAVIAVITVIVAAFGTWHSAVLSACALLLIVFISVAVIRLEMKKNMQGILDAQRIEAEKQAMELKLQESQISIMLSQIQPHFLYNTLNSIYQLCETNPMRARSMVNFFAEYLRNNLSALDEPGLISSHNTL